MYAKRILHYLSYASKDEITFIFHFYSPLPEKFSIVLSDRVVGICQVFFYFWIFRYSVLHFQLSFWLYDITRLLAIVYDSMINWNENVRTRISLQICTRVFGIRLVDGGHVPDEKKEIFPTPKSIMIGA